MIRLVVGEAGVGKTKSLIKMANESIQITDGNIVFLDADISRMFHLKQKIRYTNISDYPISNYKEFYGFICGILSQDNDISEIYADGLLKLAKVSDINHVNELIEKLKVLSEKYSVQFIFSVNCETEQLPEFMKEYVVA